MKAVERAGGRTGGGEKGVLNLPLALAGALAFTWWKIGKLSIALLDKDMKPVKVEAQSPTATAGTRDKPVSMSSGSARAVRRNREEGPYCPSSSSGMKKRQ